MDANKAVQYQSPAHLHAQSDVVGLVDGLAAKASVAGTPSSTFDVASGAADRARLTPTGIARVGATPDLPLMVAAFTVGATGAVPELPKNASSAEPLGVPSPPLAVA